MDPYFNNNNEKEEEEEGGDDEDYVMSYEFNLEVEFPDSYKMKVSPELCKTMKRVNKLKKRLKKEMIRCVADLKKELKGIGRGESREGDEEKGIRKMQKRVEKEI